MSVIIDVSDKFGRLSDTSSLSLSFSLPSEVGIGINCVGHRFQSDSVSSEREYLADDVGLQAEGSFVALVWALMLTSHNRANSIF